MRKAGVANLTKARVGYVFLSSSAKGFVPARSCYQLQVFLSDRWTRLHYGRVDPLVHRVLAPLKEIKKEFIKTTSSVQSTCTHSAFFVKVNWAKAPRRLPKNLNIVSTLAD
jgi:hypothetical protein